MRRVPPSSMVREDIHRLFTGGIDEGPNILSALAELGVRYLAQQALEQEQQDHLHRGRYERRSEEDPGGWRNGYEDARLKTAEGEVLVRVPQVRGAGGPYRSKLMEFLEGHSDVLDRLVTEMYARGLSTRDVEDAFKDATGTLLISRSAVSEITDQLWEDYQAFCSRDLSGVEVQYLFADAIFESLRRYGAKEGVLAAWCVTTDGRKVLLHLAVGNKESEACWMEFFRHMTARGLRPPTSITSDGAPGLVNAITAAFSKTIRIRCWFHRMANIRAKLPAEGAEEFMAHVRAIRDAPTLQAGEALAAEVMGRYADRYPAALA